MDFSLRCNSLKCRAQLAERAVVTTCSHIFCENCCRSLGLDAPPNGHRVCPACDTALPHPDDVCSSTLNPTEDYKTSVLSGLSPSVIMECAGRGVAFWVYQTTQEIIYQEYVAKSLTEKTNGLNHEVEHLVNKANAEIDMLNQKIESMSIDQDRLKNENQALVVNIKEKTRKQQQTQELYDRLKRKEMTTATQHAAFDSVEGMLGGGGTGTPGRPYTRSQAQRDHLNRPPNLDGTHSHRGHGSTHGSNEGMMPPPPINRNGYQGSGPNFGNLNLPSPHRTRLGQSGGQALNSNRQYMPGSAQASKFGTPGRQPMNRISPNGRALSGYGMSAGIKVGRQSNARLGNIGQPGQGQGAENHGLHTSQHFQQHRPMGDSYY